MNVLTKFSMGQRHWFTETGVSRSCLFFLPIVNLQAFPSAPSCIEVESFDGYVRIKKARPMVVTEVELERNQVSLL